MKSKVKKPFCRRALFWAIFILISLFALSVNNNASASSTKQVSTTELLNMTSEHKLKKGKYKTEVEFSGSKAWTHKNGKYVVLVKTDNDGYLGMYTTKKVVNKITDGTKAVVTLKTKKTKNSSGSENELYIKKIKITSGKTNAKEKSERASSSSSAELNTKLQTAKEEINKNSMDTLGFTIIDNLADKNGIYYIDLNAGLSSMTNTQIRAAVTTTNSSLVKSVGSSVGPSLHYSLGGVDIGKNRSIYNPEEVTFKNLN